MINQRLQSVLPVVIPAAGAVVLPHNIVLGGRSVAPNKVLPDRATPVVVAVVTATDVTFSNPTAVPLALNFYAELDHTIQRGIPQENATVNYWQGSQIAGGGGGDDFQGVYDNGGAGVQQVIMGGGGRSGIAFRDNPVPMGVDLFEVTDAAGAVEYLAVDTDGVSTDRGVTMFDSAVAVSPAAAIRLRSSGGSLQVSEAGAAYVDVLTSSDLAIGATVVGGTTGSVLFIGAASVLAQDNANLFWDDAANRLGLGTAAPTTTLDVAGTGTFTAVVAGNLTDTALTAGRVTFASVGGLLADDAGMTYDAATDLLTLDGGVQINNSALAVSAANSIRFRSSAGVAQVSNNGAAYVDIATGSGMAIGGAITGGATTGSVLFVGAGPVLAQDNANLFWDDATNRLGLGTAAPTTTLDVAGTGTFTAVVAGNVTDSALTATRVTFAGAAGLLTDDAGMFYTAATDLLNLAGGVEIANSALAVSAANAIRFRSSGGVAQVSNNGAAYVNIATGSGMAIGGAITGGATVGSVLFVGAGTVLQQDNGNLFWDDTTNRLGIGNAAPTTTLDVTGTGTFTAVVAGNVTDTALTATRVTFAGVGGLLSDDAGMTYTAATDLLTLDGGVQLNNSALAVSAANSIRFRSSGGSAQVSENGGAYVDLLVTGDVTLQAAYNASAGSPTTITLDATRDGIRLVTGTADANPLWSVVDTNSSFNVNAPSIGAATLMTGTTENGGTATVTQILQLTHNTTGTAAANFGAGIGFALENAGGTTGVSAAQIAGTWQVATAGSEIGQILFSALRGGSVVDAIVLVPGSAGGFDQLKAFRSGNAIEMQGNLAAGNAGIDVFADTAAARTAGLLFSTGRSGTATGLQIGFGGHANLILTTQTESATTSPAFRIGTTANFTSSTSNTEAKLFDYNDTLTLTLTTTAASTVTNERIHHWQQPTIATTNTTTFTNFVVHEREGALVGTNVTATNYSVDRIAATAYTAGPTSAAMTISDLNIPAHTITVSTATGVTSTPGYATVRLGQATITNASASNFTEITTLYIQNAPTVAGSATVTAGGNWAVIVDAGNVRFDDQVQLGDGSAGTPSIAFQGASSNTGLFRQAADVIGVSINGNERFRFQEGGTSGELIPPTDTNGSIGIAANRWGLVRAVTITSGDIAFEDERCPRCGSLFLVDEELVLKVKAVEENEVFRGGELIKERITRCVPMHARCGA